MNLFIEFNGQLTPLEGDLSELCVHEATKYAIHGFEENPDAVLEDYQLMISHVPIEPCLFQKTEGQVKIKWNWEPEFFSGLFYPELYYQGKRIWPSTKKTNGVMVDADARKLTREHFMQMIEDIARISEILFSLSPAYKKTTIGRKGAKLPLAQLELLNEYLEQIIRAVEQIAKNPRKKLNSLRNEIPLDQVKQMDEQALLSLLTNPGKWVKANQIPDSLKRLAQRTQGYLFESVNEVQKRVSFDTYENAFIKGFLLKILRLTQQLEGILKQSLNALSQDLIQKSIALRNLEKVTEYRKALQNSLKLPFLQEVKPAEHLQEVTVTLLKHPAYRRLHQNYLKFLLGLSPIGLETLSLSLERTYQLYEYWCFLKITEYFVQRYQDESVDASTLFTVSPEHGGISLRLKHGEESCVQINKNLKIYFQRHYNHYASNDQIKTGSYSFLMKPDIVVEKVEGNQRLTIIFDPKYRVGSDTIKAALGDMHKYKDALVDKDLNRVVQAAFILVPNVPSEFAIQERYLPFEYKSKHGFGVCVLRPGDQSGLEEIEKLIKANDLL